MTPNDAADRLQNLLSQHCLTDEEWDEVDLHFAVGQPQINQYAYRLPGYEEPLKRVIEMLSDELRNQLRVLYQQDAAIEWAVPAPTDRLGVYCTVLVRVKCGRHALLHQIKLDFFSEPENFVANLQNGYAEILHRMAELWINGTTEADKNS